MNVADEIEKLQRLRESGALSDEEFALAKARLLSPPTGADVGFGQGGWSPFGAASGQQQARQWTMLLHLSQLMGFVVPLAGLVVPIVIWQLKKQDLPEIDAHGMAVANWIISEAIYFAVSLLLITVGLGIVLLLALATVAVVFPIVGAIKANTGELWRYPLSIRFLK
jgi:uncharacterized protein